MQAIPNPTVEKNLGHYYEALNNRDYKAWSELFAANPTIHEPVGTAFIEGEENLREAWQVLTGPFDQLEVSPDDTFYGGSGAAVHWSAKGHAATGGTVEYEGITVLELDEAGKIVLLMSWWDPADMLIRLADCD